MRIKIAVIFIAASISAIKLYADSLDIYTCFKSAEQLSPLKKQELLIKTAAELNIKNISTNYFPEITISGKASYQSEVFTIPKFSSTMPDYPQIPKDQYQVSLNLKQNIFDAGTTRYLKNIEEAKTSISENQLNTDLNSIKDIVNQLFFSALIFQENIKTLKNSKETLLSQQKIIQARVNNGVVLPSVLFSIEKELLNLDQRIIQSEYDKSTSLNLLSTWIGKSLDDKTQLALPTRAEVVLPTINRPELKLFASQQQMLESNKALSNSKQLPYLYAFAQGGYGSPNPFNFFETTFSSFYIVGLQLNWKPYNWGNTNREKQSIQVQQEEISAKKEDFERNILMNLQKELNESLKLKEMIIRDNEIIKIQKKIVDQYFAQLQNGVITPTEYLAEFNSLTDTMLIKKIHDILLSQTSLNIQIKSGNFE